MKFLIIGFILTTITWQSQAQEPFYPADYVKVAPTKVLHVTENWVEEMVKVPVVYFSYPKCANLQEEDVVVIENSKNSYAIAILHNLNDHGICVDRTELEYQVYLRPVDDSLGNIVVNGLIFPYDYAMEVD